MTTEILSRQQRRFIARKGNRQPGFDPVPSKKVADLYQFLRLALLKDGVSAHESHNEAMRALRQRLPAVPIGVKYAGIKPSKSDDPAYRKVTVLKAFRLAKAA